MSAQRPAPTCRRIMVAAALLGFWCTEALAETRPDRSQTARPPAVNATNPAAGSPSASGLPSNVRCHFNFEKERSADEKPSTYRRPDWRPKPIDAWRAAIANFRWRVTPRVRRMLVLYNQLRRKHGLSTATLEPRLMAAAERHSRDMARYGHLSHVGQDDSHMEDRANDVGYCYIKIAENIAATRATADATFDQWLVSERHLKQMLITGIVHVGIAHANNPRRPKGGKHLRHYWTLIMARPDPYAAGH